MCCRPYRLAGSTPIAYQLPSQGGDGMVSDAVRLSARYATSDRAADLGLVAFVRRFRGECGGARAFPASAAGAVELVAPLRSWVLSVLFCFLDALQFNQFSSERFPSCAEEKCVLDIVYTCFPYSTK